MATARNTTASSRIDALEASIGGIAAMLEKLTTPTEPDPVVKRNVSRTKANAPTPRSRVTATTKVKTAKVKREAPTAQEIEHKRAERFDARADAGYVDTLFTFDGKSVVLVTGKYAPRFVSITGSSPSKSMREDALLAIIDLAVSIATGTIDPDDIDGDAATLAGVQYVADAVASSVEA